MSHEAPLKPMHAAAVVGSVAIDRNLISDRTLLKVGGAATYAGLTYRRHDLATCIVCNVALAEEAILDVLLREGIQVCNGRTAHTTRFVNRVRADGRTQWAPSLAAPIRWHQIASVAEGVDGIHLGPLHPEDIDTQAYLRLAASPKLVALDVQGLVRRVVHGRVVPGASEHLPAALQAADIVKADQAELEVILAACGQGIGALMDRFDIAEWIVTRGRRGGHIHVRGGGCCPYEAAPAVPEVDPTGAGDVFLAAYVVARCHQGQPVAAAGCHAARLSAEHVAGAYITPAALEVSRRAHVDELPAPRNGPDRTGINVDNEANDV